MDISNGVNPAHDRPQAPVDVPQWSESCAWWTWDDANDVGIYGHFQRHPDDLTLWRGYCVVMVGNQVYTHHSYGRQLPENRRFGYESCNIVVEEAHRRWRFQVDGAGVRRSSDDLFKAALTDGPAVPMIVDVQLELRTPVWSAGAHAETSQIMPAHYEQKGRCIGSVTLGRKIYRIDCLGANDHSFGPRNTTGLFDKSGFFTCILPSGRSLTAIMMSPIAHLGYADFGDGQLVPATRVVLPDIAYDAGTTGTIIVELGDRTVTLPIKITNRRMVMTMVPPNFEHIGLVNGPETTLYYTDFSCEVEWEGERGSGSWEICRSKIHPNAA